MIEKVVGLAENLTPIALIGAGGIGKTSIALTVLHHDRIKERFGHNRRFIRCDQFPASSIHFLGRLSKVLGAGVENPEGLTPLRPFLSSREMIVILDNAESILDPRGTGAREIYAAVEELSQFNNICLCITTRISTIPPDCQILEIPTLPKEAALNAFYRIYKNDEPSDLVDKVLEELDFHPLLVTLLATVAHNNRWDNGQLTREWEQQRTGMLRTEHNRSLAAAIELSLASPMFRELGSDARELLGVVAFFPQGINEDNIEWLFPTTKHLFSWLFPATPKRQDVFNKFCVLSLTYRSNGFITMLAPLRDYLCPKDPTSSPLLRTTKKCYFDRLLVDVDPDDPSFEATRWIISEDVNVEHLLDFFTTTDANTDEVWQVCRYFMQHLRWHKMRPVMFGPKIEGLPDTHRSKPQCLFGLSQLFDAVGNRAEFKRLLIQVLRLWRERGDDRRTALTLRFLSDANRLLGLQKESMWQAKESLEIFERLEDKLGQARAWQLLARLLWDDNQLDAAEEAISRTLNLVPQGNQFLVCQSHRLIGDIHSSKGDMEKAIDHYEMALGIASSFNWHTNQFWIHYSLAELFSSNDGFDNAHAHIERAKSHTINDPYNLGCVTKLQAQFWYKECRFEEATSGASCAIGIFEKIGATEDVKDCRDILRDIEVAVRGSATSSE